jgi:hypothetical protein
MTIAYIGKKGAGKTLQMVKDVMEEMKQGKRVISNTPIRFKYRGVWLQSITIENPDLFLKAIVNERRAIIAIDEAPTFLPNSLWHKIDVSLIRALSQARHIALDLYYTSQGWGHTVKRLRDLTDWVIECRKASFFIPRFKIIEKFDFIDKRKFKTIVSRPWKVFTGTTYSPELFNHSFTDPRAKRFFRIAIRKIYPSEAKRLFPCYSTTFLVQGSGLTKVDKMIVGFRSEDLFGQVDNEKAMQESLDIPNE